jgi:tRNA(fMet)-specific endonuclease VapC
MIVADTDVLIDFLRGRGAAKMIAHQLKSGQLATSAISAFELWCGVHSQKQGESVRALLDALTVLPLTPLAGECAGKLKCQLDKNGRTIASADALIAGICIANDLKLFTRNSRHFEHIQGLFLHEHFGE